MRARLDSMVPGAEFHFLCVPKMADRMDEVVLAGGGRITNREDRSYAVVLSVCKQP
ncbi:MAG: hypothetical protein K9K37_02685 [Desulfocapsa sp.]|nr:hypothetical protein [Desulfocapsa sp.]